MKTEIQCDFCEVKGDYDSMSNRHQHPELEIGGVPVNIWTPKYSLPTENRLDVRELLPGIVKFRKYLPFKVIESLSASEGSTGLQRLDNLCETLHTEILLK